MANQPDDKLKDLLSDNWTSTNTSNFTPEFVKITNVASKVYDFNTNAHVVLFHRPTPLSEKNSIGKTTKRKRDKVRIDLRVYGKDKEDVFVEMYNEIIRILETKIQYPFGTSDYDELNIDNSPHEDLSDRNKGLFRFLIPVELINYNATRG